MVAVTPLSREFYLQDTVSVAQQLLGKKVIRRMSAGEVLSGVIVETEAYIAGDPASHSFRGQTRRNSAMFGPPGHAYVYISYGMHEMLNIVCGPAGVGEAVLVRALEPLEGIPAMRENRGGVENTRQLTNGPGKLAQALGLTRAADDRRDLTDPASSLIIAAYDFGAFDTVATTRIGISKGADSPWRFYIRGNSFVSRR